MDKVSNKMNTGHNMMDRGLYAYYTLFAGILLMLFAFGHGCEVEIQRPYHPMYMQTGETLQLVCTARNCKKDKRVTLQWWRQTESSAWAKEMIVPRTGDRWVLKNLHEEPSGNADSTLVLSNIAVADHGWYVCRDEQGVNSYTIWVSTLRVDSTPDVVVAKPDGEDVTLGCTVMGLNSNLPGIDYLWMLGELQVINISSRYTLFPPEVGTQRLQIHKPEKRDGGYYKCSFVFGTNLGPRVFSKTIHVNTTLLKVSGSGRPELCIRLVTAALLLVMAMNQWPHLCWPHPP